MTISSPSPIPLACRQAPPLSPMSTAFLRRNISPPQPTCLNSKVKLAFVASIHVVILSHTIIKRTVAFPFISFRSIQYPSYLVQNLPESTQYSNIARCFEQWNIDIDHHATDGSAYINPESSPTALHQRPSVYRSAQPGSILSHNAKTVHKTPK